MPRAGVAHPIDDAWKAIVKSRLHEIGWTASELARRLGRSRQAVSDMLGDGQQSTLVPAVELALGMVDARTDEVINGVDASAERRGPSRPVTDEWRQRVAAEMESRDWNQAMLADALGVSRTAVTDLLTKLTSSTLVRKVDRLLWPAAADPASSNGGDIGDLVRVAQSLSPADVAMLVQFARRLAGGAT